MKTIGVLGGIGPQATMDFEARVHRISQQLIPQRGNGGYPPMVVYYLRHAPVMLATDLSPVLPLQPDPRLIEAAKKLSSFTDFLVITSNTPHLFQDAIEAACGCKVLSMIDATLAEVQRRQMKRVGLLGLGEPTVYQTRLDQLGLAFEVLSEGQRTRLDRSILALMEGQAGSDERNIATESVEILRDRHVDGIILGCTEIPLLLNEDANQPDLINPAQLLAETSVRYAAERLLA